MAIIVKSDINEALEFNHVEFACLIAESHMLAQIVTKQYDYCEFQWTKDGSVICDGHEDHIDEYLNHNLIGWFMKFVPFEVVHAITTIAVNFKDDPMEPEEFPKAFIFVLHRILKTQHNGSVPNCFCEDPDSEVP